MSPRSVLALHTRRLALVVVLAFTGVLLIAPNAWALTFNVNTTENTAHDPNDSDTTCDNGLGACSLRAALETTENGSPGPDVITFSLPPGPNTLAFTGNSSLAQSQDLDIQGPGASQLTVSGGSFQFRVFSIGAGATVSITGLTVCCGEGLPISTTVSAGGGIFNRGSLTLDGVAITGNRVFVGASPLMDKTAQGGGIFNDAGASLTLKNSTVTGNFAHAINSNGDVGEAFGNGGGIFSAGTLTISNSTIDDNHARATDDMDIANARATAFGGGVVAEGNFDADHSTFSNNTAEATATVGNGQAQGGAIVASGPSSSLELTTVAGNRTKVTAANVTANAAGIIHGTGAFSVISSTIAGNGPDPEADPSSAKNLVQTGVDTTTLENTIVANPLGGGANCEGTITSGGFNLDFGPVLDSCDAGALDMDPLLGPLQGNGGPTQTMALQSGSPAIDKGSNAGQTPAFAGQDQRGLLRPADFASIPNVANGTDIGAYEEQVAPVLPDLLAPITRLGSVKINRASRKAKFTFSSNEPGSTFLCKLDKKAFASCSSPKKYKHLKTGKHKFQVEAKDAAGNLDTSPAIKKFRI